jgi:hypothetical protein
MKSDKEETMMTAKLINVEGSKIKIELTLELSRWLFWIDVEKCIIRYPI